MTVSVRRMWRWWRGRRRAALVAAALALAALWVRVPGCEHRAERRYPRASAALVAHSLADYSVLPHRGSWAVEEEHGNYTRWWYRVRYECGARCSGRAAVHAEEGPRGAAPAHGHAAEHRVRLSQLECVAAPLFHWPQFCDEFEVEWVVESVAGGGSAVRERGAARCGAARALSGACGRDLRARAAAHHDAVLRRLAP